MRDIRYGDDMSSVTPSTIEGFFVGWPSPPPTETLLAVLHRCPDRVLAWDGDRVVGFVYAVGDGLLSAYVPLLEVLPSHQGRGIGTELVRRLLTRLDGLYMVDLTCDPDLAPFYERLGFRTSTAMMKRDYHAQSGRLPPTRSSVR